MFYLLLSSFNDLISRERGVSTNTWMGSVIRKEVKLQACQQPKLTLQFPFVYLFVFVFFHITSVVHVIISNTQHHLPEVN